MNEKVEGIEGTVTTQGTAIVQTAADITALAKRVTVNEGTISTNTMWSDKIRHHLTSLHTSIWDIVEFGAQVPKVGDEGYDSDEVAGGARRGRGDQDHQA